MKDIMLWLRFNKINSNLGDGEQVMRLFLKAIQMEILMFLTHTIQPITVGIQSLHFGMNKVRKVLM